MVLKLLLDHSLHKSYEGVPLNHRQTDMVERARCGNAMLQHVSAVILATVKLYIYPCDTGRAEEVYKAM